MSETPYGASGAWQGPVPGTGPAEQAAWGRARTAATVQLFSPFVYSGVLLAGLVWEIPIAGGDPHGYTQIFGFFASLVLLVVMVIITAVALALVNKRRRSGVVLTIVVAAVAALQSLGLATGYPGGIGELAPVRILTILVGVIWLGVSVWCAMVAARALAIRNS